MRNRIIVIVLMVFSLKAGAQDPEFTQFYAAPLYLNPAFAGSARCPRVTMNYRNQWPALAKTFITTAVAYDQQVDALSGGLGLMVMNDKAGEGTINTTNISGIYSYQLNISRDFSMRLGLQATWVQKKLDWDKLFFGDMIDPRYGYVYQTQEVRPEETRSYVDFSAGVLAYSSKVYGGVAVNHLTEPDEGFIEERASNLPMKVTAHIGAMLPIGESRGYSFARNGNDDGTYISPNILYQQQAGFNQLNLGVYIHKSPIVGGLWYRGNFNKDSGFSSESFIVLLGVQKGLFKFGYSYDVTISKLTNNATAGSHEVSFGLQFECRPKKKRFRTIRCPSF